MNRGERVRGVNEGRGYVRAKGGETSARERVQGSADGVWVVLDYG